MNKQRLAYEAVQWVILCTDEPRLDERELQKLWRWLRRSKWHVIAFLEAARVHAKMERWRPMESTRAPRGNVIPLFGGTRRGPSKIPPAVNAIEPVKRPCLVSRRGVLAAMVSGVTVAATVTIIGDTTSKDVIRSGHVLRVPLRDGLMHAARHSSYRIGGGPQAQTVHLMAGQAAFHLWAGARRSFIAQTPLCQIFVDAARFALVVMETMVELTVAEGTVRVVVPSDASSTGVTVAAGQQLVLRPGVLRPELVAVSDVEREFGWTRGELFFSGETIGEAAATFNRFNLVRIEPSPEVAHLSVGSQRCALDDPQRFVDRFVAAREEWGLVSRRDEGGKVIRIFGGGVISGEQRGRDTF